MLVLAKCGRVQERIGEHLGKIPETNIEIEQFSSIKDAGKKEGKSKWQNTIRTPATADPLG